METAVNKKLRLKPDLINLIRKNRPLFNAVKDRLEIQERTLYRYLKNNNKLLMLPDVLKVIEAYTHAELEEPIEEIHATA